MVCQTADPNGATPVGTAVCVYVPNASPPSPGGDGVIRSYNGNGSYAIQITGPPIVLAEALYSYLYLGTCSVCNLTCSSADYSIPIFGCTKKTTTWLTGAAAIIGGYILLKKK